MRRYAGLNIDPDHGHKRVSITAGKTTPQFSVWVGDRFVDAHWDMITVTDLNELGDLDWTDYEVCYVDVTGNEGAMWFSDLLAMYEARELRRA